MTYSFRLFIMSLMSCGLVKLGEFVRLPNGGTEMFGAFLALDIGSARFVISCRALHLVWICRLTHQF